ncbi:hypothetical protein [Flavobacterium sp. NKUCC04_CG]|uniref:hypothetical protein n=1 Tax=Flavobacterium sp. NKUCC04_CG TaxID=2842121 RepID=UPI001C5AAF79|nr:hypothetical protein [Flavobacterium sp. NKUCC04_CG]MBW3518825.1 hypothetical protein [Flavobacterium sp. NKUCC04_CG]
MKKLLCLFLVFALFVSCSSDDTNSLNNGNKELILGVWNSKIYTISDNGKVVYIPDQSEGARIDKYKYEFRRDDNMFIWYYYPGGTFFGGGYEVWNNAYYIEGDSLSFVNEEMNTSTSYKIEKLTKDELVISYIIDRGADKGLLHTKFMVR